LLVEQNVSRRANARAGFSLIETLLALGLSSFIMFGLMQAYQTLVKFIGNAREISHMNQRIALLTNLIERDLSSACMPLLHRVIESNKAKGISDDQSEEKPQTPEQDKQISEDEKKKQEEKWREERKKYFFAEIDDADFHKFKGKKVELLKACSFITTNALELYGESSQRFVRVRYELIRDKKSKGVLSYTLVRKQTTDISNMKMKISEVDPTANLNNPIALHEVMHGVKGLFIEFSMLKEPEKKESNLDNDKKAESELIKAFSWGETKKTVGEFPQRAHVYIDLWNDEKTRSEMVEIEVFMLTADDVEKILTAAKGQRKQLEQTDAVKPAGPGGSGMGDIIKNVQAGLSSQGSGREAGAPGKPAAPTGGKGPTPLDTLLSGLEGED
jgi:hypothetical protein